MKFLIDGTLGRVSWKPPHERRYAHFDYYYRETLWGSFLEELY